MPARILEGNKIAEKIKERVKKQVEELGFAPALAIVEVGKNEASQIYAKQKQKACKEVGIETKEYFLEENAKEEELLELIEELNNDEKINGILVQLPLPKQINAQKVMEAISPLKDVDGFHPTNRGKNFFGENMDKSLAPCTAKGIIKLIEETKQKIEGKKVVVVGTSNIVGKPAGMMLLNKGATVAFCNKFTKNLHEITKTADILVVAVGKPKLISGKDVKKGAIVIDVGINRLKNGKIAGDVDFESARKKASFITPVPGGVGPMTVAFVLENTVIAAEKQEEKKKKTQN